MAENTEAIIITKRERAELARMLRDEVRASLNALGDFHTRIGEWNRAYEGILSRKDEPWDNCANLHVPITQWQVDTIAANVCQIAFGMDPPIHVEPAEGGDEAGAASLMQWLRYLTHRLALSQGKGKQTGLGTTKHGTAIMKLTQHERVERIRSRQLGEDGNEGIAESVRVRTMPRLDFVPLRDFVICPAEALSIGEAVGVGDRKRVRLAEVKRREASGLYDKGTVKALEDAGPDEERAADEVQEQMGVATAQHEHPSLHTWERWELIWALPLTETEKGWKYDPKNGAERDCLVTIIGDEPVMARCILYPWFHNRRHYIPFRILPREAQFFGRSIPEILKGIQDEVNTEHNQRTDLRTLVLKPPLIIVDGTQIQDAEGKRLITYKPGAPIWVSEKDAMEWMKPPQQAFDSVLEEGLLLGYTERATGGTEAKLGKREPGEKTLGEIQITEAQGNVRFEDMVKAFQGWGDFNEGSGLIELAYQMIGLSFQFSSPGDVGRVLGPNAEWIEAKRPDMSLEDAIGAYDYVPMGNTLTSNPAVRQNHAILLYDRLMMNPLVSNHPVRIWHVTKDVLDAYDKKDWRGLIGTREDAETQLRQMAAMAQAEQAGGGGAMAAGEANAGMGEPGLNVDETRGMF